MRVPGAAVAVGLGVVEPAEPFAVRELVGEHLMLRRKLRDARRLRAVGQLEPRIGARALDGEHPALGIDRNRARALGIGIGDPGLAVGPQLHHRVGLFLPEQERTVRAGTHAVGIERPLPDALPLGPLGDHARYGGDCCRLFTGRLLLRGKRRGHRKRQRGDGDVAAKSHESSPSNAVIRRRSPRPWTAQCRCRHRTRCGRCRNCRRPSDRSPRPADMQGAPSRARSAWSDHRS